MAQSDAQEPPTIALAQRLSSLHAVCLNAGLFRDLAQRRDRVWAAHTHIRDARAKAASARANELAEAGATPQEQLEAAFGDIGDDDPPHNEPTQMIQHLHDVLANAQEQCVDALGLLRAGAGKELDHATGQSRSLELHTKLQDARSVFIMLAHGLANPRSIIATEVESMERLGERFGQMRAELVAVVELGPPLEKKPLHKPDGWTKGELMAAVKDRITTWSASTFDAIREDAGVKAPPPGGKGQQHRYGPADLRKLIQAAESGNRRNKDEIVRAWRDLLGH